MWCKWCQREHDEDVVKQPMEFHYETYVKLDGTVVRTPIIDDRSREMLLHMLLTPAEHLWEGEE